MNPRRSLMQPRTTKTRSPVYEERRPWLSNRILIAESSGRPEPKGAYDGTSPDYHTPLEKSKGLEGGIAGVL
jgi:hypothetical protein